VEEFEVDMVDPSAEPGQAPAPDYNVAPTKPVLAVVTRRPGGADADPDTPPRRQLRTVRWGLVPSWAKDPAIGNRMINARLETAPSKPAFRRAFARRRCLLPADGYYEWYTPQPTADDTPDAQAADAAAAVAAGSSTPRNATKPPKPPKPPKPRKQPFFIHRADGRPLALAGLYEFWRPADADPEDPASWLVTATILTTTAPDDTGRIHDRAPLLVHREHWQRWLDPDVSDPEDVLPVLVPAAPGLLEAYPVSTAVNDVRNNGPHLLDPLPATR